MVKLMDPADVKVFGMQKKHMLWYPLRCISARVEWWPLTPYLSSTMRSGPNDQPEFALELTCTTFRAIARIQRLVHWQWGHGLDSYQPEWHESSEKKRNTSDQVRSLCFHRVFVWICMVIVSARVQGKIHSVKLHSWLVAPSPFA